MEPPGYKLWRSTCSSSQLQQHARSGERKWRPLIGRLCVILPLLLGAVTIAPARIAAIVHPGMIGNSRASTTKTTTTASAGAETFHYNLRSGSDQSSLFGVSFDEFELDSRRLQGDAVGGNKTNATSIVVDQEFCDLNCAVPNESSWISVVPFGVQIVMIIILLGFSALFSGLTLGIMGLDKTGLEIVMGGDDAVQAAAAKAIYPVRKKGNLLLCTLLLGNVAVNALLSILLADKTGGAVGFISSTFLIVIFGEIVPQACCSRYALAVGSRAVPLVKIIIIILYPAAFPLAFLLDKALGEELPTIYSSSEMLKLFQIHVQEHVLDKDTAVAMTGALKYKDMTVSEVMTPIQNTFMLSVDEKLNFETIAMIFETGYSRIPVYEISKNNVIGLLFVKDLIFIDPNDDTPIRNFVQIFGRDLHMVWPVDKLGDVLRELKEGRSHMALVRDVVSDGDRDPYYVVKGIITLEDIIEEIIGHEIVDETDAFVDGTHQVKVDRTEGFEWAKLRLLGSKVMDEMLSHTETKAITAHLFANHPKAVAMLTENQVQRLIAETPVTIFPTATRELGKELPEDLIYEKEVPSDVCTLILSGKVTVIAGVDEIRTDVSSWTLLGISALRDPEYKPDFTAFVCNGPCRCIQISRERFGQALDASASERHAIQEDSFRNLAFNKPTGSATGAAASSAHSASEVASEYSEGASERVGIREDRRSKLIAALQIARRNSEPDMNSASKSTDVTKESKESKNGAAPDTHSTLNWAQKHQSENDGVPASSTPRVSFVSDESHIDGHQNGDSAQPTADSK